ncbi:ABC transporter, fused permease protein [hydrothermal vent metagenome]|uniref:ABC transporter, fused permease protein n=1 Tax=hydrothermal vent metagenome TaxID=652676 RepID=A0A3B1AYH6_9ZZZZ
MNGFRLALRHLGREWRAGELTVLAAALVIAVASVTSVNFFTSRIHQALEGQANDLLGGDLVFLSDKPITSAKTELATELNLQTAKTVEFPTIVLVGEKNQLVALKAVSAAYPLRGHNRTASKMFAQDAEVKGGPAPGTVWSGSRLLTILGVDVGDEITVGNTSLKITAVLTSEPDQSEGVLLNIAPRLLMHTEDLPATGLIQPASRVVYRLLLAGEADAIDKIRLQWKPTLAPGETLHDVQDARPEIRSALGRGEGFLALAALVSVLLAGAAVAMATRRFISRHLDNCAIMRCLGAEQATISQLYTTQMVLLGVVASMVGIALGYLAQWGLMVLLAPLAGIRLPSPSWWPVLLGFVTGMVTLLGFAIPPILQLKNVPTLRVLRRDLGGLQTKTLSAYGIGIAAFALLVLFQAQDLKLAAAIIGGLMLVLVLLALVAGGMLLLLRPLREKGGAAWRFGLVNIYRRSGHSLIQMVGFGIGLMALLLLAVVRTDLLSEWENRLPADAPNRFLINIQPEQLDGVRDFLRAEQVEPPLLYPMVRARLTGINGKTIAVEDFPTDRGKRLVQREFNLSWSDQPQVENKVVSGSWWQPEDHGKPIISVEKSLADELGLTIGDTLTYNVAEQQFTAEITNLRMVKWDSFKANFFVVAPPGLLDSYPVNYISGFYLPTAQHGVLNRLVQQFPNITVLDVATILDQVRIIIEQVILAVEYVFFFTLLSGLMVMYAAIHATLDDRIREAAVLRTLGARRSQLLSSIILEYAGLGLLSGLVGAITAGAVGMVVAQQIFDMNYIPGPTLWLSGMLIGAIGVGLAGTLGTKFVLDQPPLKTLRDM